ncbi:MAG: YdcF family protein [Ruminococcaceae bacterium]|nr:YdcF family protein [Oscillospiraceae bacterium]
MFNNKIIDDITDYIFVTDKPEKSDIIFLPGGSFPSQGEYAAELYREGYASLIMPSGGLSVKREAWPGVKEGKADIYDGDYKSDCEFLTDVLIKNGVPISAVIGEDKSGHTRDNAFFSRKAADDRGFDIKSGLIVCKSFHARRCLMLYQMAFPTVRLIVCPFDVSGITRDSWFMTEQGVDRVLGELARCGNQFAEDIKEYLNIKK